MEKKIGSSILIKLLFLQCLLSPLCIAEDFDFFYFVQQWPGSYCDTSQSCCYPLSGKPESDFGIHGLWPNYKDGTYPSNCDSNNPFDLSKVSDLLKRMEGDWPSLSCPSSNGTTFWSHEWEKHGTCSESVLDQHDYFKTALNLKDNLNLLQILQNAGIKADGGSYSLSSIKDAIKSGIGSTPWIQCNEDESGNRQLYQIYICVDNSGSNIIECPVMPTGKNDGSWPKSCDNSIPFNASQVSDLIPRMEQKWPSLNCPSSDGVKFWTHEWKKHGTCSLLNEHDYFQSALDLKEKANLLQVLKDAKIEPNGDFYSLESIEKAIKQGVGYSSSLQCNFDVGQNQQLYQVYLCVDKSAKEFIDCPISPRGRSCGLEIEFPPFSSPSAEI
ncbi:hypothetical protein M9H77_09974 [Catharanthus roseus]|uniref:Uncharacterized protein n=1 Tax=Catharanthus roseus TaxID=4058 RepID=A0ACC0C253_CATRO|nr:hypothetical protein M9H77_09974 [Catharanthus roseus]